MRQIGIAFCILHSVTFSYERSFNVIDVKHSIKYRTRQLFSILNQYTFRLQFCPSHIAIHLTSIDEIILKKKKLSLYCHICTIHVHSNSITKLVFHLVPHDDTIQEMESCVFVSSRSCRPFVYYFHSLKLSINEKYVCFCSSVITAKRVFHTIFVVQSKLSKNTTKTHFFFQSTELETNFFFSWK